MIELRHIAKTVPSKTILKDISFSLQPGLTCLVGPSGAGKTTLLNIIGTLDQASAGSLLYSDEDGGWNLSALSPNFLAAFRAEKLGFVFQNLNLFEEMSLEENIHLGLDLARKQPAAEDIYHIIQSLGLEKLMDTQVKFLSAGERQRAALAGHWLKTQN